MNGTLAEPWLSIKPDSPASSIVLADVSAVVIEVCTPRLHF